MRNGTKLVGMVAVVVWLGGCAGGPQPVRFTIHSDPPGGYVMLKLQGDKKGAGEWIFLGSTPLVSIREMDLGKVKNARAVALRVVKEGFFEQKKEWGGKPFLEEFKEKGRIFWNPRLIRSTR